MKTPRTARTGHAGRVGSGAFVGVFLAAVRGAALEPPLVPPEVERGVGVVRVAMTVNLSVPGPGSPDPGGACPRTRRVPTAPAGCVDRSRDQLSAKNASVSLLTRSQPLIRQTPPSILSVGTVTQTFPVTVASV